MRWRLWPFRPGSSTSAPAPVEGARAANRDWASLPSIQRSVGATRLTAESVSFVRGLSTRAAPDLALARLGHVRSPEAPAGLLVARAVAPPPAPAPTLLELLRPWSRAPRTAVAAGRGEVEVTVESEPSPDVTARVGPEAPEPSPEPPVALRLAQVVPVPERPEPTVTSLTQAPLVHVEPPVVQVPPPPEPVVVEEPSAVSPNEPAPAGPRLNLGQSRRLRLGPRPTPELPLAQRSGEVHLATGEAGPESVAPEPPVVPAELQNPPSSAGESTAQRALERGARPLEDATPSAGPASVATPPVPSLSAGAAPEAGLSPMPHVQRSEPAAPASPERVTASPILRVRRRVPGGNSEPARLITIQATGERVEAGQSLTGSAGTGAAPSETGEDPTPGPSLPAGPVPDTPLVLRATTNEDPPAPVVEVAPAAEAPTAGGTEVSPTGEEPAAPIVPAPAELTGQLSPLVFRTTLVEPGGLIPQVTGRGARGGEPAPAASPTPGTPDLFVARTVAPGAVAVSGPDAAPGEPVRDLTGSRPPLPLSAAGLRPTLAVQPSPLRRTDGGPSPAVTLSAARPPLSMAVQALSTPVPAEALPPAAVVPPMPLFRPGAPAAPAPVVQPFPDLGSAPRSAVADQVGAARDAASSELGRAASEGRAMETRTAQGVEAAEQAVHHAAGATGVPSSDKDVEELAGRLYDRIRSRLRSELLIGRERAGQITDLR